MTVLVKSIQTVCIGPDRVYRRQDRRKAAKVADSNLINNNNNEEIPAEEAENIITSAEIHTDRVIYPQQEVEPEPEKSKHNPSPEAVELPFTTSEIMTEFNDKNLTDKAEELPCKKTK